MSRERRRLFQEEESPAEPGRFGCPMLSRAHRGHPVQAGKPMHRCNLGWSIDDDLAVARCRATEAVADCWKEHPERTPVIAVLATEGVESEGAMAQAFAD